MVVGQGYHDLSGVPGNHPCPAAWRCAACMGKNGIFIEF